MLTNHHPRSAGFEEGLPMMEEAYLLIMVSLEMLMLGLIQLRRVLKKNN